MINPRSITYFFFKYIYVADAGLVKSEDKNIKPLKRLQASE